MNQLTGFDSSLTDFIIELIKFDQKLCPHYKENKKYVTFSDMTHTLLFQLVHLKRIKYTCFSFDHQVVLYNNKEPIDQFIVSVLRRNHDRQIFFIMEIRPDEKNVKKICYGRVSSFLIRSKLDIDAEKVLNLLLQHKYIFFAESVEKYIKMCVPEVKFPTLCKMFPEISCKSSYEILEKNSETHFDACRVNISSSKARITIKNGNRKREYFIDNEDKLNCYDNFENKNGNNVNLKDFLKAFEEAGSVNCDIIFF